MQRGEINMWSTRYKRLRDGFRVLQARLAKQIRATNANPTQSQKGELVSPPESSLLLLQAEMVRLSPVGVCGCGGLPRLCSVDWMGFAFA